MLNPPNNVKMYINGRILKMWKKCIINNKKKRIDFSLLLEKKYIFFIDKRNYKFYIKYKL